VRTPADEVIGRLVTHVIEGLLSGDGKLHQTLSTFGPMKLGGVSLSSRDRATLGSRRYSTVRVSESEGYRRRAHCGAALDVAN